MMDMKKIGFCIAFNFFFSSLMFSQASFGPSIGFNISNFRWDGNSLNNLNPKTGVSIGVISQITISEKFEFETGLLLNRKGSNIDGYDNPKYVNGQWVESRGTNSYSIVLSYLNIPFNIVFVKHFEKGRVGFFTGPELGVLFLKDDNNSNPYIDFYPDPLAEVGRTLDLAWNIGMNGQLNKGLGIKMQYGFGLINVIKQAKNNSNIKISNRCFNLSLYWIFKEKIM